MTANAIILNNAMTTETVVYICPNLQSYHGMDVRAKSRANLTIRLYFASEILQINDAYKWKP